jgi:hypothetical protein
LDEPHAPEEEVMVFSSKELDGMQKEDLEEHILVEESIASA